MKFLSAFHIINYSSLILSWTTWCSKKKRGVVHLVFIRGKRILYKSFLNLHIFYWNLYSIQKSQVLVFFVTKSRSINHKSKGLLPSSAKPQLDGLVLFSVNAATHPPHILCNHLPNILCNHPHTGKFIAKLSQAPAGWLRLILSYSSHPPTTYPLQPPTKYPLQPPSYGKVYCQGQPCPSWMA